MTYQELLLDKKWKSKRNTIIADGFWVCSNCQNQNIIARSKKGQIKSIQLKGTWLTLNRATPYLKRFEIAITLPEHQEPHVISLYTYGTLSQENFSAYNLYYEVMEIEGGDKIVVNAINEIQQIGTKWRHVRGLHVHHKYYQDKLLP